MSISASDVKKLRDMTGAGMMDAKEALKETNGDFDAAVPMMPIMKWCPRRSEITSLRAPSQAGKGL